MQYQLPEESVTAWLKVASYQPSCDDID